LGRLLAENDLPEEALSADREAVELYGTLHSQNPAEFKRELMMAVGNCGNDLRALGHSDEEVDDAMYEILRAQTPFRDEQPS